MPSIISDAISHAVFRALGGTFASEFQDNSNLNNSAPKPVNNMAGNVMSGSMTGTPDLATFIKSSQNTSALDKINPFIYRKIQTIRVDNNNIVDSIKTVDQNVHLVDNKIRILGQSVSRNISLSSALLEYNKKLSEAINKKNSENNYNKYKNDESKYEAEYVDAQIEKRIEAILAKKGITSENNNNNHFGGNGLGNAVGNIAEGAVGAAAGKYLLGLLGDAALVGTAGLLAYDAWKNTVKTTDPNGDKAAQALNKGWIEKYIINKNNSKVPTTNTSGITSKNSPDVAKPTESSKAPAPTGMSWKDFTDPTKVPESALNKALDNRLLQHGLIAPKSSTSSYPPDSGKPLPYYPVGPRNRDHYHPHTGPLPYYPVGPLNRDHYNPHSGPLPYYPVGPRNRDHYHPNIPGPIPYYPVGPLNRDHYNPHSGPLPYYPVGPLNRDHYNPHSGPLPYYPVGPQNRNHYHPNGPYHRPDEKMEPFGYGPLNRDHYHPNIPGPIPYYRVGPLNRDNYHPNGPYRRPDEKVEPLGYGPLNRDHYHPHGPYRRPIRTSNRGRALRNNGRNRFGPAGTRYDTASIDPNMNLFDITDPSNAPLQHEQNIQEVEDSGSFATENIYNENFSGFSLTSRTFNITAQQISFFTTQTFSMDATNEISIKSNQAITLDARNINILGKINLGNSSNQPIVSSMNGPNSGGSAPMQGGGFPTQSDNSSSGPTVRPLGNMSIPVQGGGYNSSRPPSGPQTSSYSVSPSTGLTASQQYLQNRQVGGSNFVGVNAGKLNPIFADRMQRLIAAAESATGGKVGTTEGYRTPEVQAQYWANFKGITYTYNGKTYFPDPAKLGHIAAHPPDATHAGSEHQGGMALDIDPHGKAYEWMVSHASEYGIRSLALSNVAYDPPHFDIPPEQKADIIKQTEALKMNATALSVASSTGNSAKPLSAAMLANLPTAAQASSTPQQYFGNGVDISKLPQGMQHSNPTNIKYNSNINWEGQLGPIGNDQGDPQVNFSSSLYGMRAGVKNLISKFRAGKKTINDIIASDGGWTPGNYQAAANIAATAGYDPSQELDLNNPAVIKRVMKGIVRQEHGPSSVLYKDETYDQAIQLATGVSPTGNQSPKKTLAMDTLTGPAGGPAPAAVSKIDTSSKVGDTIINTPSSKKNKSKKNITSLNPAVKGATTPVPNTHDGHNMSATWLTLYAGHALV